MDETPAEADRPRRFWVVARGILAVLMIAALAVACLMLQLEVRRLDHRSSNSTATAKSSVDDLTARLNRVESRLSGGELSKASDVTSEMAKLRTDLDELASKQRSDEGVTDEGFRTLAQAILDAQRRLDDLESRIECIIAVRRVTDLQTC